MRQFDLSKQRLIDADRQSYLFGPAIAQGADDSFEMFSQHLWREHLVVNGRIQQRVIEQAKYSTAALQMHCFGGASAQINRDHLVAPLGLAANKRQTHIDDGVEQEKCQGRVLPPGNSAARRRCSNKRVK